MAALNKVILLGNLTRDPEIRVTGNNLTICKLGIAVSRNFTTRDGEKREETTFVDVDAFGKQAEVIGKYMSKGRPILVEGRLQLDTWETQNGEKRSKLKVVCENFQFIGGRSDESGSGGDYESSSPPSRSRPSSPSSSSAGDDVDEDLPF